MKTLAGVAALMALVAAPATAADMPQPRVPIMAEPVVAPVYNWTGLYSASTVGGEWWDITGTYANPLDHHSTSGSKFLTGSHIGYQYQAGNWVFGVEAGFNFTWGGHSAYTASLSPSADCLGTSPVARTCESRVKYYGTAGGKLGWAWNNFMIYSTGGFASGKVDTDTIVTGLVPTTYTSITSGHHPGWYAGLGADMFVMKLWWSDLIIGVEYQHVALETKLHADTIPGATGINNRNIRAADDIVQVKLTSKYWTN
jgi:outer membrane immunogenic protein